MLKALFFYTLSVGSGEIPADFPRLRDLIGSTVAATGTSDTTQLFPNLQFDVYNLASKLEALADLSQKAFIMRDLITWVKLHSPYDVIVADHIPLTEEVFTALHGNKIPMPVTIRFSRQSGNLTVPPGCQYPPNVLFAIDCEKNYATLCTLLRDPLFQQAMIVRKFSAISQALDAFNTEHHVKVLLNLPPRPATTG